MNLIPESILPIFMIGIRRFGVTLDLYSRERLTSTSPFSTWEPLAKMIRFFYSYSLLYSTYSITLLKYSEFSILLSFWSSGKGL